MKTAIKVSCLNPKWVVNPAYRRNPIIHQQNADFFLKVPCGRCRLCRSRVAKEWQFRLHKEFESTNTHKHNSVIQPRVAFLTFTFSDEHYTDDDSLFAPWLIRFRDNFRKAFGKSPRYFAITDRGAKEGRLHLHMLLFDPYDYKKERPVSLTQLKKRHLWWPYGFIDLEWVKKGVASANYVIGYITGANIEKDGKKHGVTLCEKAQKHKPRIFPSKGIGKGFDVCQNYLDARQKGLLTELNGFVYVLPRYYRYKWWSRHERWLQNRTYQNEYDNYLATIGLEKEFVNTYLGGFSSFESSLYSNAVQSSQIRFELLKSKSLSQQQMLYSIQQLRRFDTPEAPKPPKLTNSIINPDFGFEIRPWEFSYKPDNLIPEVENFPF